MAANEMNNIEKQAIVIFGGNGDLAMRKLLPALFNLQREGLLDDVTQIVGASNTDISDENYVKMVEEHLTKYLGEDHFDMAVWDKFSQKLHYCLANLKDSQSYGQLKEQLATAGTDKLVAYFALPPFLYRGACEILKNGGLINDKTRAVLEKPIGTDLESSKEINDAVANFLNEDQTYRIDHYLGKETVQNLLALRFGNFIFEPLWKAASVDSVQITACETVGVEGRWAFYDDAGAMRDMIQNHLMQLLCLVGMEVPVTFDADSVRNEKLKVLKSLRPIKPNEVSEHVVRGQYRAGSIQGEPVPGYDEEGGKESTTETFVALRTYIDNWRWRNVPFYLRTGKRMAKRYSEIVIQFKTVPHCIFEKDGEEQQLQPNKLIIRLQPDEGIQLMLMNKVPSLTGEAMELREVPLNLNFSETFNAKRTIDAYERLLRDVLAGNATLFMRRDEVEAAWDFIDPIINTWNKAGDKPKEYVAGTYGPAAAMTLPMREGFEWHE